MGENLRVRTCLKDAALAFELDSQLCGINEIAVVGESQAPGSGVEEKRLDILIASPPDRFIADMAYRRFSLNSFKASE